MYKMSRMIVILAFLVGYCSAQGHKPCTDISPDACAKFYAKKPDMCTDLCIAKICQDTCRYCPMTCYHCDEEASPEDCKTQVQCATTNQYCIAAQRYTTDFHVFYTSGCAEKELCRSLFGFNATKRSIELEPSHIEERSYHLLGGCCDTNLCNEHDPGNITATPDPNGRPPKPQGPNPLLAVQTGIVQTNDTCFDQDLDTEGCRLLIQANSSICQNDCIATQLCPKECGTCYECKNCNDVHAAADCTVTKQCLRGQECVSVETLNSNFEVNIRLGCMDRRVCDVYFNSNKGVGKRQFGGTTLRGECCDSNMCNVNGIASPTKRNI